MMGREQRGWDYISFAPSMGGWGGNGYVPCHSLFSTLFVSFSHSSSFPLSTVQQQAGLDARDAMGPMRTAKETQDEAGGGRGQRTCHVTFCPLLCLFLLPTLLLFHYLQYNNKQGWVERNGAGQCGRDSNTTRGKGAGGRRAGRGREWGQTGS